MKPMKQMKLLHMRFGEVQLLDETHESTRFKHSMTLTNPSRIRRLDSEVLDSGFPVSNTLSGGVKTG